MTRDQLEHVLRAVSRIANERDVLVIGSQSVLGAIPERLLPAAAVQSLEVDVTFFDDPEDRKSNLVDGAIGEWSAFHETNGYYAQGVSVTTAILPAGWENRLVVVETASTAPGRGLVLEPHDCVLSKLAAGREKDYEFAAALIDAGLIDPAVLVERVETMPVSSGLRRRILDWVDR